MKIKKIHIRNFRSIQDQTIALDDVNLLVGKNDSGKSNLLKALNLFFNGQTGWNEEFLFDRDYCTFAKKGVNKADQIEITLYFNADGTEPVWRKSWRSDSPGNTDLDEMWDKKTPVKERNKATGFKNFSRIPSMLRKVNYIYVPALKSPQFIAELIGKLNKVLSQNAKEELKTAAGKFEQELDKYFSEITGELKDVLGLESALHLPQDLQPIFQALEFLDQKNHSLTQHGDGIRAQHIPILLNHIARLTHGLKPGRELYSSFVWGYEEPENNIEIGQAYKFAKTFVQHAKKQQIILTTHSPAFYSLPESLDGAGSPTPLFINDFLDAKTVWKQGSHSINRYFVQNSNERETLFKDGCINDLDGDFILPLAARLQARVNELLKEKNEVLEKLQRLNKPSVLYVEGITDKTILEAAWEKLNPGVSMPFSIEPRDNHYGVRQTLNIASSYGLKPDLYQIGLFDFDSGYNEWNGMGKPWDIVCSDAKQGLLKKRNEGKGFSMLLPVPEFREHQASSSLKHNSILSIELLFPDAFLKGYITKATDVYNPDGRLVKMTKKMKIKFADAVKDLDVEAFAEFRRLFDSIKRIMAQSVDESMIFSPAMDE
jgi:energy-coupling factor transporter ATP-binding protein EcfA2